MAVLLANEPFLQRMQSVVRTMLGLDRSTRRSLLDDEPNVEVIFSQVAAAADLLIDALRLREEFAKLDPNLTGDEELARLRELGAAVEQLTEDYSSLIATWRETIEAGCRPGPRPSARVH